ncbi:MAG: hypothetical protein EZS28_022584 [Streblomastix strix]|uniref:Uncharacterized protein n=1 Tax=Streblomastix strix TaxID=222440 RepID=A0A5J4VHM8_9EUKA|nr:MAG: hypothetical protein EZS28_022584 [Streblomastix strix]
MPPKIHPDVVHLGDDVNVNQAIRLTRRWASLNRRAGRVNIPASEIRASSKGANYWKFVNEQQIKLPEGHAPSAGFRSTVNNAKVEVHPDGHTFQIGEPNWHDKPHIHGINADGKEVNFTFGQPSRPYSGKLMKGIKTGARVLAIAGIAVSFYNIKTASAQERTGVIIREAASYGGGYIGSGIGAIVGAHIFPGIGTVIGGIVGGYFGSRVSSEIADKIRTNNTGNLNDQVNPGGISLSGELQVDMLSRLQFDLPSIDSVYMDKNGKLVLISSNNQGSKVDGLEHVISEDFLLALAIALSGQQIHFSLDPWDPQQPDGPYYQKVFYPEILRRTAFGETLFQTDYNMKKLAFGLMQVPGLTSEMSFRLNEQSTGPSRHRLWIVSDDIQLHVTQTDQGQQLEFGPLNMRVCCKALQVDPNSSSGLRDVETADSEQDSSHIFSKHMTEKYNLIAQKHPEYARLQNLAKLFALAKWLVEQGVDIDPELIVSALRQRGVNISNNLSIFESLGPVNRTMNEEFAQGDLSRAPVDRLSNSKSKTTTVQINPHQTQTQTHSWTLTGGIDLETVIQIIKQTQPIKPLPPDLFDFIADTIPNHTVQIPGNIPAVVIPINILSEKMTSDMISTEAEKFVSSDPKKAFEIASNALNTSSQFLKANIIMAQTGSQLGYHKDAFLSYINSAILTPEEQKSDEFLKLADISLNEIWKQPLNPQPRARWLDRFDIYVPGDWIELQIAGVDPSLSQIFISQNSNLISKNSPIETMIISELSQSPDFATFVDLIRQQNLDDEILQQIYSSCIPDVFATLDNPHVVNAGYVNISSIATFVTAKIFGSINDQQYAYYHFFILPDSTLGHGKKCLFLMLSCRDVMAPLMNHWSNELWDMIIESVNPITHQRILPDLIRLQQDHDIDLQAALFESLQNARQSNEDAEITKVEDDYDDDLAKAIRISHEDEIQHRDIDKQEDLDQILKHSLDENEHGLQNVDIDLHEALVESLREFQQQKQDNLMSKAIAAKFACNQKHLKQCDRDEYQQTIRPSSQEIEQQQRENDEYEALLKAAIKQSMVMQNKKKNI